jgi:AraC-like DNA-binding protein
MRAFRSRYGLPPHAYLVQIRLQAARRLLLSGSSVIESALATGFYDQSRLGRFFRRAYGISPARYAIAARE